MNDNKAAEFHLELNKNQLQLLLDMMKLGVKHTYDLPTLKEMNYLSEHIGSQINLQVELMSINPTNEEDI